ncbi:divalent-cation tolerance protein CutA [Notoacmeibacter sp. MSK16QG-6]|uniref:divalent-cation tolerance protein CutA n=1 Tax=Notoacmeibacter sp. MSK16QG-6 TaxID=2957982 RepID=UPI0020A015A4|nr:divalent-cation tolerance protein CutA [Notoacmeibacter sp. MSK16QG-6]MCP1198994.1 divalent-cation tolerance protein CutA [Notoacmeibacter sp. MSK16QG-6]
MIEVHVTTHSRDTALKLAQEVLAERLAACANIIDDVTSLYWWEGQIAHEKESLVIFRTSAARADALTGFIAEQHDYDLPAIIRHEPVTPTPEYSDWVEEETKADK